MINNGSEESFAQHDLLPLTGMNKSFLSVHLTSWFKSFCYHNEYYGGIKTAKKYKVTLESSCDSHTVFIWVLKIWGRRLAFVVVSLNLQLPNEMRCACFCADTMHQWCLQRRWFVPSTLPCPKQTSQSIYLLLLSFEKLRLSISFCCCVGWSPAAEHRDTRPPASHNTISLSQTQKLSSRLDCENATYPSWSKTQHLSGVNPSMCGGLMVANTLSTTP